MFVFSPWKWLKSRKQTKTSGKRKPMFKRFYPEIERLGEEKVSGPFNLDS
jgi:hypothetical protein